MKKTTKIHGVRYTIWLMNPNSLHVTKHTADGDLTELTSNIAAYQYIDKPGDKYNHMDAKRHLKGLFLT